MKYESVGLAHAPGFPSGQEIHAGTQEVEGADDREVEAFFLVERVDIAFQQLLGAGVAPTLAGDGAQ